jgi:arylsulfatase
VTIAEALRPAGYTTLMTGKWHVGTQLGRWPLDRGFDRFFGTPSGGGVYFKDTLKVRTNVFFVHDNQRVEPPDDLYVTDTFTDYALQFVEEAVESGNPFFLYLAHIAPHWPLQAKPEDIDRYRGVYDQGWDAVRAARYERQREMGLFDGECRLSPRDPQAGAWDELSEAKRADLSGRMSIYAAQVDCIDQNVGRLVERLKHLSVLDNTLFMFLSDNGCSAEGGPGGFSRGRDGAPIGAALSYASVGLQWANAADTPLRRFKMSTHEGGIATPLVVHWPDGIERSGRWVREPGHVIDLMPTCLEVAGVAYPSQHVDRQILPPEGRSLLPAFAGERIERDGLYWEHQGNRAVRVGDWKLVAQHQGSWELYDLRADRTELNDLAGRHPQRVRQLAARWDAWAARCGVEPWPVERRE